MYNWSLTQCFQRKDMLWSTTTMGPIIIWFWDNRHSSFWATAFFFAAQPCFQLTASFDSPFLADSRFRLTKPRPRPPVLLALTVFLHCKSWQLVSQKLGVAAHPESSPKELANLKSSWFASNVASTLQGKNGAPAFCTWLFAAHCRLKSFTCKIGRNLSMSSQKAIDIGVAPSICDFHSTQQYILLQRILAVPLTVRTASQPCLSASVCQIS